MPLEGHYERQTTPLLKLTPREIKVVFGILAVTLIAMIAVVAFTARRQPPAARDGLHPADRRRHHRRRNAESLWL